MRVDPLQYVDQIRVRINIVENACRDEALDLPDVFGADFGPTEQQSFSAHGYYAECAFQMV
jgi:hypothetical protein